jgi:hypothetical protein
MLSTPLRELQLCSSDRDTTVRKKMRTVAPPAREGAAKQGARHAEE